MGLTRDQQVRLVVADASPSIRDGVKDLVSGTEFVVIAEAETGNQAVELATSARPDMLLLAVNLPGLNGLLALTRIQTSRPELPVLMLSNYGNPMYLTQALELGASGCIVKGCSREIFLAKLRSAGTPGSEN